MDNIALAKQILRDRYKPYAFSGSAFTVHQWVNAAEHALEGDLFDLEYMLAEDDRMEREVRAECIRNGCNLADYRYEMSREGEFGA